MILSDAWLHLLDLDDTERINNNQIFSMLADLGVFAKNPKIRLVIKSALEFGLWKLIKSQPTEIQVLDLRLRLQNEGFANDVIDSVISSFYKITENVSNVVEFTNDKNESQQTRITYDGCNFLKTIFGKQVSKYDLNNCDELNKLIYHIPDLNQDNNITIHKLICSYKTRKQISDLSNDWMSRLCPSFYDDEKQRFCLEYDITNNIERKDNTIFPERVTFYALVVNKTGRICSKEYITSIKKNEKYAIAKGFCEIDNSVPLKEIGGIIVIPENGDLDLERTNSNGSNLEFEEFRGEIDVEPWTNKYSSIDIKISNIKVWGKQKNSSISFEVTGNTKHCSGWQIGKELTIAWINHNGRLVETTNLFIGKKGSIGPRGGLYDTRTMPGSIKSLYFRYIKLSVDIEEVSKIIISEKQLS
jgi:hypothetical protein